MIKDIILGNLTIDCKDAVKLRDFYASLLGWEPCMIQNFPVLRSSSGLILLFNQVGFDYIKPVWPEEAGQQQKQMHFDFHVENVAVAVSEAEKIGAMKAYVQYGGQHYVTMIDPEGHPFCLCEKNKTD